ncbi:MAG: hypothetical protein ACRD0V_21520 [Acidimicrobiales bacterium]
MGTPAETGEDVFAAPGLGDERELVRAFTDLHRQDQFVPAARPVAPLRGRSRPATDVIDARVVEVESIPDDVIDARAVDVESIPDDVVDAPDVQPPPPRPDLLPHRPLARSPKRAHHDVRGLRAPDPAGDVRRRGWAGLAERRLSDVLALAAASGAFVAPWAWLMGTAGICVVIGAIRSVTASRSVGLGIVALPVRAARRVVRLLRPRSLVRLPVITIRIVLAAIVLPAAVAATIWVADHGADGVWAAVRLAAWQSGFRVFAAVLCLMMLAGIGNARAQRAARLRRATASWPDAGVVALAAGALALAVAVVAVGPRVSGAVLTGADGLAWAPARLRPAVDRVRDDVVGAELRALGSCLTDHQEMVWSVDYTADNPSDAPDVARLAVRRGDEPGSAALVTAALAADNQLAAWVEVVEIAIGDAVVLELDRRALGHHGVRGDPATLGPGVVTGGGVVVTGDAGVDRRVALVCSAGPVL